VKTRYTHALSALILTSALAVAGCSSGSSPTAASSAASSTGAASSVAASSYVPTTAAETPPPLPDAERWLPAKHLAAATGWSGVPSGVVYENGNYHVFYPHNPTGDDPAGAVDWAHATSPDLVNWTEQPVAIAGSKDDQVLSGSVVVDEDNTSGLGTADQPALVSIYTGTADDGLSLASSTDHGQTWSKYSDNPVLPAGSSSVRDPKVFWYAEGGYWVLVAAAENDFSVQLYKSKNLTDWTKLSEFTGAGVQEGAWANPDLFPLPLDGDADNVKWVLPVSIKSGAVAGGSGVQYFSARLTAPPSSQIRSARQASARLNPAKCSPGWTGAPTSSARPPSAARPMAERWPSAGWTTGTTPRPPRHRRGAAA